jgi:diguanylate cyclase (GGDEF)-like protein/PAS domain S-box-containing protein
VTPGELAREWVTALSRTNVLLQPRDEIVDDMRALVELLTKALAIEPYEHRAAHRLAKAVGGALVAEECAAPETVGISVELLGRRLPDCVQRWDRETYERLTAVLGAFSAGFTQALRRRTLDGQEALNRAVNAARDDAEQALRVSEARFRAVFARSATGIALASLDGRVVEANDVLLATMGYQLDEVRGHCLVEFIEPADVGAVVAAHQALAAGEREHLRMEHRLRRRDGASLWTDLSMSLIRDEDGRPSYQVVMVSDVTEQRQLQARLEYEAAHDPLTGLPNRSKFLQRLNALFSSPEPGERVGVCFLDLDGFKAVNDSLGHQIGDRLLVAVGARLAAYVETVERDGAPVPLVARMSGDEFVVLVERSSGTEAVVQVGEGVLAALEEPVRLDGHELAVRASIGVLERPVEGTGPDEVMRAADTTLYWAKSDGKGRLAVFDAARHAREVTRCTLSATMPGGLDRGEFVVDYQPLVKLNADGPPIGVEALVRWQHPRFGRLSPGQFIDLAEETGAVVPLGRWVLEEACRQAKGWQERCDPPPFVSVNLSVRQCGDPDLLADVTATLERTGLPPGQLQLEVTETVVMGRDGEPLAALRALADLGVRIAIDDFGTGYSNLAYLRSLPVQELKLAGPFLEGLRGPAEPDPLDWKIVSSLVGLAHALDLTVTAEGVETAAQAERLGEIGCDAGQGWYFAPPGPPESISPLLDRAGALSRR